jgi:hypothetical protein
MKKNKNITLFLLLSIISTFFLTSISTTSYALTTISPGDIYILRVNSDFAYPGGTNSNGFDFVSKIDLDPGTEIYFADKAWDDSLAIPFWRNTLGEGALRYTVPAGGLSAGTIVSFDDTMIPSLPTSGTSTWDLYTINPTTGAATLTTTITNGFDPATSGDNILVFQGTTATPTFIYGIGWGIGTPWISSGSPTSNNSYLPAGISSGSGSVTTLGTQDNYQYNCSNIGMYSSNFATSVQNIANWNVNDATPFGTTACTFDVTRPTLTIDEEPLQDDPTNNSTIKFDIVFSNAITPASFTISDLVVTGTGTATVTSLSTLDNITWTVTVNATTDGTILVNLPANTVTELASGNSNANATIIDNSVTYDSVAPSCTLDTTGITFDNSPEITGSTEDINTSVEITIDGNTYLVSANASGEFTLSSGNITPSLTHAIFYPILATCTDAAGNSATDNKNIVYYENLDLLVNVELANTGQILSGNNVTYNFNLQNTNATLLMPTAEILLYNRVPGSLVSGIAQGSIVAQTSPDLECIFLGMAGSIGDAVFDQYSGEGIIECGFITTDPILPGDNISFSMSFTSNSNFINGTRYSIFVIDGIEIDTHSTLLYNEIDNVGDPFSLINSSVDSHIYNYVSPTTTTTTTVIAPPSNGTTPRAKLPSTGSIYFSFFLQLAFFIILGGAILIIKIPSRKRILYKSR